MTHQCPCQTRHLDYRVGYIVAGGTTGQPRVRLKGEATYAVVRNYAEGYVPTALDQVLVLVESGVSIAVIGCAQ